VKTGDNVGLRGGFLNFKKKSERTFPAGTSTKEGSPPGMVAEKKKSSYGGGDLRDWGQGGGMGKRPNKERRIGNRCEQKGDAVNV